MNQIAIRANYRGTKTTVNTVAIQNMFNESGQVGRHAKLTGRRIKEAAIAGAPVRTGDLKLSHTGPHYSKTYLGGHVTVGNNSDHARYVHAGTTGPILPHNHTGMLWIRPAPHSWFAYDPDWPGGRTPLEHVRGQSANPWMADAMRMVVRLTYYI